MGANRDLMDRLTRLVFTDRNIEAYADCLAADAVVVTPDEGEVRGRDAIIDYMRRFMDAFPDARYELTHAFESADGAADEGYFIGTQTGPLATASGKSTPATGKEVRVRSSDAITVEGGLVKAHRLYYDLMDMFNQLGLSPSKALA
ncbi:MAG: ester cyclase [Nocardioidaceae bacterium]